MTHVGEARTVSRLGRRRVVIVDASPRQRGLLVMLLGLHEDLEVVGEGEDGHDIVWLALTHQPDVIVCDLGGPPMDALDALQLVRTISPATKVIVFSADSSRAEEARLRGVDGWVPLGVTTGTLVDKVRELASCPSYY